MSDSIQRSMPFSNEAEQGILSCCLWAPEMLDICAEAEVPTQFYHPANRLMLEEFILHRNEGKPNDLVSLTHRFLNKKIMDKVGGPSVLAELYGFTPTPAHFPYYMAILGDSHLLRSLIQTSTEIIQKSYEYNEDVLALVDYAEQRMLAIRPKEGAQKSDLMRHHVMDAYDTIEALTRSRTGLTGKPTGFTWLDSVTRGIRAEIWYIGARPSVGKTALLLQLIATYIERGEPVGFFSLEMSRLMINLRLMSILGDVAFDRIMSGVLNREENLAIARATKKIQEAKFLCDDRNGLSHSQIRAKARRWKREYGVEMIGVDFLQRMSAPDKKNQNRADEHALNSTSLADGVKELGIPWIVLAQLNRECEKANRRPRMSDFEGCGRIEQDADVALLLSPTNDEDEQALEDGIRHVHWEVAKQRNGSCESSTHIFKKRYARFGNYPMEHREENGPATNNHRGAKS